MKASLKNILPIVVFGFSWAIAGMVHAYLAMAVCFFTFFLAYKKGGSFNLLGMLLLLLVFSDSDMWFLTFARSFKPVIVLFLFGLVLIGKIQPKIPNRMAGSFIPFFIWILLIPFYFWGEYTFLSFQKGLSYGLIFFIAPLLFNDSVSVDGLKNTLQNYITLGFVILLAGIVLAKFFPHLGAQFGGRLNGIFRNPNGYGIFTMLFYMIYYISMRNFSGLFSRQEHLIINAALLYGFISCGSRAQLFALGLFISGYEISFYSNVVALLIYGGFFWFGDYFVEGAVSFLNTAGLGEEMRLDTIEMASGRIYVWDAAWMEIREYYFWIGKGLAFAEDSKWMVKYYDIMPDLIHNYGNIHNTFLTIWLNTGLVGMILFLFSWLYHFVKLIVLSKFTVPVFLAVVFSIGYESWLAASLNPFTIQLILICSLLYLLRDEKVNPEWKEQKLVDFVQKK